MLEGKEIQNYLLNEIEYNSDIAYLNYGKINEGIIEDILTLLEVS